MNDDEILKALANPVRRDILRWLKSPATEFSEQTHPLDWGVCVGRICERAALSQSTVSAHLAALQKAELITSHKVGQWIFIQRNEPVIAAFVAQLADDL